MKKIFISVLLLLAVVAIAGFSYLKFVLPAVSAAPQLKINIISERVERGKYLANHVMVCMDCHSERNFDIYAAPLVAGTEGRGGEKFDQQAGFPGAYIAPNITPAHLGSWTDGEIFRALTTGVNKQGKALFPVMPYLSYGKLDREDIYDVIAYIRTLKPIKSEIAESESDFPMSLIINTIPQQPNFITKPRISDTVAYGRYLITAAACADCHTPQEKGEAIESLTFAGGFKFNMKDITIQSDNITPDKATGIGNWTEQQFINRFKAYDPATYQAKPVGDGDMKTIMPWTMFAGMNTDDLKAIYQYLRTVKPVNHRIEKMVVNKVSE